MITHSKVSSKPDGADASLIRPSDWNDEHVITAGYFLPRIATLVLSDEQIKATGTPYVIIPATETLNYTGAPTQIPVPISVVIRVNNEANDYSNVDSNAKFVIALGSDWSMDFMNVRASGMSGASTCKIYMPDYLGDNTFDATTPAEGVDHFHKIPKVEGFGLQGNLQDNALSIVLDNISSGDLSGGDGANSLKVTVVYHVVDL